MRDRVSNVTSYGVRKEGNVAVAEWIGSRIMEALRPE
jgi:hypothetical protein